MKVDIVIDAMAKMFEMIIGKTPRFRVRLLKPHFIVTLIILKSLIILLSLSSSW